MKAIQTINLTKRYGKHRGIENVGLAIDEGDFFGFIGPNGAGKSTTIRTLLGLIFPTSGTAEIFGKQIVNDKTEILAQVGYLPSEAIYYGNMRVRDILSFAAKSRRINCKKEAAQLCERLELDPSRKVGELSLGNRKKVGIVLAMQHNPRLYILDEPTSGLDPLMQQEFYSLLKERNRQGATVFLSSHILSEVTRYCEHAAVIREGSVLVSDSVKNLAHTGVKQVTLQGIAAVPEINGTTNMSFNSGCAKFLYRGEQSELIRALSALRFEDVTIADPDFEDIFLHYYTKEEDL